MRIIKAVTLEELENYANGTVYGVLLETTGQNNDSHGDIQPGQGDTARTTISSTSPLVRNMDLSS